MTAFLVLLIAPRVTSNLANIASCHAKPILRLTRMTDPNDEQFVLNGIFRFLADLTDSWLGLSCRETGDAVCRQIGNKSAKNQLTNRSQSAEGVGHNHAPITEFSEGLRSRYLWWEGPHLHRPICFSPTVKNNCTSWYIDAASPVGMVKYRTLFLDVIKFSYWSDHTALKQKTYR